MTPADAGRHWRIIGVGSPVSGDDLGWKAIEALRDAGLDRHAELLALDRPGPALLEYLQPDGPVILIDAMQAGLAHGTIRELSLDDLIAEAHAPSTHDLGVADTLALGQALGCLPRRLYLLGLQAPEVSGGRAWPAQTGPSLVKKIRLILNIRGDA